MGFTATKRGASNIEKNKMIQHSCTLLNARVSK
jgi:hypothetical protein